MRKTLASGEPTFSMIEKASGRFIGNIELRDADEGPGELGVAITGDMQGRGYGTEAVRAMIFHGREQMGLKRIWLRANPDNGRAIRVYEKCGFRAYRRTDGHVFMEIKEDESVQFKKYKTLHGKKTRLGQNVSPGGSKRFPRREQ